MQQQMTQGMPTIGGNGGLVWTWEESWLITDLLPTKCNRKWTITSSRTSLMVTNCSVAQAPTNWVMTRMRFKTNAWCLHRTRVESRYRQHRLHSKISNSISSISRCSKIWSHQWLELRGAPKEVEGQLAEMQPTRLSSVSQSFFPPSVNLAITCMLFIAIES